MNKGYEYIDQYGSFRMEDPQKYSYLYFPIANDAGMKSSLTPVLGGDAKTGQNTFLLQPVSAEELHNNKSTRNFWCRINDTDVISLTGAGASDEVRKYEKKNDEEQKPTTTLEAGFMWHKIYHELPMEGLSSEILSFVPCTDDTVELMMVTLHNNSKEAVKVQPVAAIPIYGRSADNLRDHRHVTSLLHRIYTLEEGVAVNPVLTFDERGHKKNRVQYYALGAEGDGTKPVGFYPVVEDFIGEGGSLAAPGALYEGLTPQKAGIEIDGYEALGGIVYADKKIEVGESASWIIMMGIQESDNVEADSVWMTSLQQIYSRYASLNNLNQEYEQTKQTWRERVKASYQSGDHEFDQFMNWVSFQPILRRIYGCSFLPHHDYGKGGRGWRDLWQDCLALLMMNPDGVRRMLIDNYGGVRVDGTNATIIGTKPGEFIADRNHITRVWMDHGMWPLLTTAFYIDQTGDLSILLEKAPYFKDAQIIRGTAKDANWNETQGCWQRDAQGDIVQGSILEHILVQHLTAFYEVGEHNHMRLRDADWNDALDMANECGESVAFTAAYEGNLRTLAELLAALEQRMHVQEVELLAELEPLWKQASAVYENIAAKQMSLNEYCRSCSHQVSGRRKKVAIKIIADKLTHMSEWIMNHIRETEWIEDKNQGWFNSYYDNHARAVEGHFDSGVRMMLTGQVFAIMSGTAQEEQIRQIVKAADAYLYDAKAGGYRLNTDFHERKDDLGRMFGFAYGHKENGAVFSHMTTMYANALYQRGFAREGYKALHTLYEQAANFEVSRIYPGIPEYFNDRGRGMYHYLTGAASWYMMTIVTQMYGVRGRLGDLCLSPKLLAEQFDEEHRAAVNVEFAGVPIEVVYHNDGLCDYGAYRIDQVRLDEAEIEITPDREVSIPKNKVTRLSHDRTHRIDVRLVPIESSSNRKVR